MFYRLCNNFFEKQFASMNLPMLLEKFVYDFAMFGQFDQTKMPVKRNLYYSIFRPYDGSEIPVKRNFCDIMLDLSISTAVIILIYNYLYEEYL